MILEEKDAIIAEMRRLVNKYAYRFVKDSPIAEDMERYLAEYAQPQVCDQHLDRKAIHSGQCVFQSDNCNCCRECLYQCVRQDKEHAQERPTE
jgi:hypothetical protein